FIMKDAYSFDRDEAGLEKSYRDMYSSYQKVFDRCGLTYRAVEADTGAIGGSNSHEFCALSEVGESEIVYCDSCDMAATAERAAFRDAVMPRVEELPLQEVETPGTKTIEAVAEFLGIPKEQTIKALLFSVYRGEDAAPDYAAVFIRGDRQLNKTKLVNALKVPEFAVEFADESAMHEATGCVGGFTGPTGLHDCMIIVDSELVEAKNLCAGACREGYHLINVNYGRDYKADIIVDLKLLQEGDPCPVCGEPVKVARGIEVGQVFKLGTKYSESMHAYYKDETMQEHPIVMGCYGIGVTRTLAAVVEQHHDKDGIIWPMAVAPYHVMLVQVNMKDETQTALAGRMYDELTKAGVEVCLDDREERPGVKFKDADLLGFPIRITVGKKAGDNLVEFKLRREEAYTEMKTGDAVARATELVRTEERG
ncbi:MAG: proline--tRNA ligase, partial [Eubacteriales bacterium]|nr:proline--tRNA ligase [Eubacteriales bacterium]